MNYRSLLKPENVFLLIIFFLGFFFFKFSINEFWDFFLVPNNKDLNFSDLRCLQKFDDYNYFFYDSKNLYNIKDTDDYKEFHFSVCKKDGIWNFCVNDDKKHY